MKIFSTQKELHFLHCTVDQTGLMTLSADLFPNSHPEPFEDWFTTVDVSHIRGQTFSKRFAANILANRIASATRRAAGNILFVPDHDTQVWFQHTPGPQFQYVINYDLKPNELRCTFWKQHLGRNGNPVAVDGGVQFSPTGFSAQPNYKDYFARCFL
jgi:hypothetical protein